MSCAAELLGIYFQDRQRATWEIFCPKGRERQAHTCGLIIETLGGREEQVWALLCPIYLAWWAPPLTDGWKVENHHSGTWRGRTPDRQRTAIHLPYFLNVSPSALLPRLHVIRPSKFKNMQSCSSCSIVPHTWVAKPSQPSLKMHLLSSPSLHSLSDVLPRRTAKTICLTLSTPQLPVTSFWNPEIISPSLNSTSLPRSPKSHFRLRAEQLILPLFPLFLLLHYVCASAPWAQQND